MLSCNTTVHASRVARHTRKSKRLAMTKKWCNQNRILALKKQMVFNLKLQIDIIQREHTINRVSNYPKRWQLCYLNPTTFCEISSRHTDENST